MKDFVYLKPPTLKEALEIKRDLGRECYVMCGGTDLLVQARNKRVRPRVVVDLKGIPQLSRISKMKDGNLSIGATVTLSEIISDMRVKRHAPILVQTASKVGSMQIRNRASAVGNICNCSPCADTACALSVLDAFVETADTAGTRLIPFSRFAEGPGKTALKDEEIVTRIVIPPQPRFRESAYYKLVRRRSVDLALASVAVYMCGDTKRIEDNIVRISLGAVAPTVVRAREAEKLVSAQVIDEELARKAAESIRISPITDIRASAEYRWHMCKVFTKRGLLQVYKQRRLHQ